MDLIYPGVEEPTVADRIGAELADTQLDLIEDLKQIRIDRDLSISDVAARMKVDPAQVSRFESGSTNPTMSTVRRYAKAVHAIFTIETSTWESHCTQTVHERASSQTMTPWISGAYTSLHGETHVAGPSAIAEDLGPTWLTFTSTAS